MILEMPVPSPGESISEVEIAQWLVEDGDYVEKDQTIAEVDSDKATLDLPAQESGTITLPTLGANTSVKTAVALHFAAGILNLACLVHPSKSKILPHCIVIYDESRTSSNSFCTRTPPIFPLMPPSLKTMIIHDHASAGAKISYT